MCCRKESRFSTEAIRWYMADGGAGRGCAAAALTPRGRWRGSMSKAPAAARRWAGALRARRAPQSCGSACGPHTGCPAARRAWGDGGPHVGVLRVCCAWRLRRSVAAVLRRPAAGSPATQPPAHRRTPASHALPMTSRACRWSHSCCRMRACQPCARTRSGAPSTLTPSHSTAVYRSTSACRRAGGWVGWGHGGACRLGHAAAMGQADPGMGLEGASGGGRHAAAEREPAQERVPAGWTALAERPPRPAPPGSRAR